MLWKLGLLAFVTIVLIFGVIPIRTHAVKYDVYNEQPPQAWSFSGLLQSMYFTPTTLAVVAAILIVAAAAGFWIVRASR